MQPTKSKMSPRMLNYPAMMDFTPFSRIRTRTEYCIVLLLTIMSPYSEQALSFISCRMQINNLTQEAF